MHGQELIMFSVYLRPMGWFIELSTTCRPALAVAGS
jgi:hypothetical protein